MFDEIVVKEDDDTRGRPRGDAARLIEDGILEARDLGIAKVERYGSILDETKAITTALDDAPDGGLVVILPESVTRAIAMIEARGPVPQKQPSRPGLAV